MGRTIAFGGGALPILCGSIVALPGVAMAQAPQAPTTPIAPTREELSPPAPTPPERPRLSVTGDIERAPCPLADPAYADLKVTITGATFNNLGPVSSEELKPAYAPFLGADRPVATICDIRDAAATLLRRKGYLAAVQVPVQKIAGGVVTFEVLYAKVTAIRVRGETGRAESLIAGYLSRITGDGAFNRFAAERYLLLARDLPGYDVRLALRPAGTGPGELIGDVTVTRTPFEADFNVQNYAGRDTGRFGGQLRAQLNGLTGLGDRTVLAYYSTADFKEQRILQAGHDFRLGAQGLTLGGRFTYAWTHPDLPVEVRARTLFATGEASYPFRRSQGGNLRGAIGMDYVDQTVRLAGIPLTRDRLRVGYVRLDGDATDVAGVPAPRWRLNYSVELRRGFDIFNAIDGRVGAGAVVGTSRADGDATSTLVRASASAEFALTPNISFSIAPRAQYAFDPLLSFEEYSAGTYTVGRGYDPGTILGDSGAGFSAELRVVRVAPFGPSLQMQPFAFVDSAWVWNRNSPGDPQRLTSIGGGVRASFAGRVRLDVALAVPTKRAGLQAERGDARLLVSLTTKLFPWGAR